MCERNYTNLPLDRTRLKEAITNYLEKNNFNLHSSDESKDKWRLEFYKINSKTSLINIYFNNDGTSTIQYKQGQNPEAGKIFADYLYDTINPDEFMTVNMSLINIPEDEFNCVMDELYSEFEDINIEKREQDNKKIFNVISDIYKDKITLTYHNTKTLQIQGKPLTCYKRTIYYISTLLDMKGIESVLMKYDSNRVEVLNTEMAEFHLKSQLGDDIFKHLNRSIKLLLVSSVCVKFSSPNLPDYCMLLYPEFRALEGMLKQKLINYGLIANECDGIDSFAGFFIKKRQGNFEIKQDYKDKIPELKTRIALCNAYDFFNKHRNSLFHMNEHVDSSRMISDINEMNRISGTIYNHLKNLI